MTMLRPRDRLYAPAVLLLLALATAREARAQAAIITGRVTNDAGAPIVGANVYIQTLNVATQSGNDGQYSLSVPETQASGQRVQLSARFIGFAPLSREVTLTPGPQTQNFSLRSDPFRLEEMVVTGVAEATSAKKLSFSVARVTEEQLREVPASSPVSALAGKVSGVRVAVGTGVPGSTPTIRLRGSTSLGVGGSQPLIIVDGVITTNSISDIDANDIETIEVLKGAAASAFYGSNAANGVVNITTKRGRNVADGETSFTVRSEYGTSGLERYVPLNRSHPYKLNPDGSIMVNAAGSRVVDDDGIADNAYPSSGPDRWRNQLKEWIPDGESWSTTAQLGLRRGSTNLHTTFTTNRNQGILPMTRGQDRQNLRLNVDQGISDQLDFSASLTYGLQKRDQTSSTAGWFTLLQAPPDVDLRHPQGEDAGLPEYYPQLPSERQPGGARTNPLYSFANDAFNDRRERILGAGSLRYRPTDWLRLEGSFGTDRLNQRSETYLFRGYLGEAGQPTDGSYSVGTSFNVASNAQINATASRQFGDLYSTTRAAYIVESDRVRNATAAGTNFTVGGVPNLEGFDNADLNNNSLSTDTRAINYAISQAFDFRDRYILDLMWRRDGSSLFGPNQRWQNFYRASGAWIVSEDVAIPGVQLLKLRAARGTAGLRPAYADQYETYTLANGAYGKNQLGNHDLKPAIQTENEFGLNVQFLDRFDLELVRAERRTEGAFLNVPLSLAQSGGFVTQVQNAADVGAKTTELSLNVRVYDSPDFSYDFTLTGDNTTQRILRMDRAPFRVNAGGANQDVFYYKSGEVLGIVYGTRWVRELEQLRDNPANADIDLDDYTVNPLGYVVAKGDITKPIPYVNAQGDALFKIGDVNPDLSFGWANTLRFKGVGLYALLDGVRGGDIYNFTKHWMFQDHRHGDLDQAGKPADQKVPNAFYASGLYNALNANDYFVEDGSYVRLRELSLSYDLSPGLLQRAGIGRIANGARLAIVGRNLVTWTNYSGFDPEVTSGNDFNFRIDGFRYPNFRTITGAIELSF